MATKSMDTEVVVVGAGPVGLMLAGELRLGGAEVIVLETRETATTESRASTLHARTMEILDSRGLLVGLGSPQNDRRGHFGGIPLDLTLPSTHPGQWKVPQTETERRLHDWAWGLGADILRQHELRAVRVLEDGVQAVAAGPGGPVRVRARHLVGCDGEQSTVRRLLGADFPGEAARRELLRADVAGIVIPDRRFERLDRGLAIAARHGDGVTRVMVHEFGTTGGQPGVQPVFHDVVDAWKRITGEDISAGTPLWVNSFHDGCRQLTRYRHGRVLFAGDAAHQQMPIGGQALNLGLQDAVNLGWKLAATVRGWAPEELLDTYCAERRAVGRQVLENIRAQALLLLGGPEVEPLRAVLGTLIAEDGGRSRLASAIAGLDVRYDVGGGDHPLLGARLPQLKLMPPQGPVTSMALLRAGRGLLLDLSGSGTATPASEGWRDRITAVACASWGQEGALHGATALLVRPDGYVVWAGTDGLTDGLTDALTRWFGPGQPPARALAQS